MRTDSMTGAAVGFVARDGCSKAGCLVGTKDGAIVGAVVVAGLTVSSILWAILSTRLANVIVLARLE